MRHNHVSSARNAHHRQRKTQSESERIKKYIPREHSQKQVGVAIFISDKADLKLRLVTRDKGHFKLIRGTIHQVDITIVNIYIRNFIKQALLYI
jgi:hypothetical protein